MAKRRKCYYDVTRLTQAFNATTPIGTTNPRFSIVRVTQQNATTPSTERYGDFLEDVAPLTGGSSNGNKRKNAVSAWFVPRPGYPATLKPEVEFVGVAGTSTTAVALPFQTAGGGTDAERAGADAIYTRHFRVRIQHVVTHTLSGPGAPTIGSVRGTLYVQRQHTIEV